MKSRCVTLCAKPINRRPSEATPCIICWISNRPSPGVNPKSETPKLAKYDKKGFMKTTADGHRCFSREFKIAAVRRVLAGEELNKVAGDLDIRYDVLWKWKKRVVEQGEEYLYTVGRGKRTAAPRKNPMDGEPQARIALDA